MTIKSTSTSGVVMIAVWFKYDCCAMQSFDFLREFYILYMRIAESVTPWIMHRRFGSYVFIDIVSPYRTSSGIYIRPAGPQACRLPAPACARMDLCRKPRYSRCFVNSFTASGRKHARHRRQHQQMYRHAQGYTTIC